MTWLLALWTAFKPEIKLGLGMLGGAAVLAAFCVYVQGLVDARNEAQAALREARQEIAYQEAEARAGRAALADREVKIMRLSEEKHALTTKLKEVYANDPNARAWADTCLPDSVLCLLQ